MIQFDLARCLGCGSCEGDCFPHAIQMEGGGPVLAHPDWCIRCGHCIALCPAAAVYDDTQDMTEVREPAPEQRIVDPDTLLNLMQFRRATRHFRPDAVPDEVVARLLAAGRWCPTAKNRQPTSFIIVRDKLPELRRLALDRLGDLGMVLQMKGCEPDMARRAQSFVDWKKQAKKDPDFDPLFFHAPMLLMTLSDKEGKLDAAACAAYIELEAVSQGLGVLYSGYFAAAQQGCEAINQLLGLEDGQYLVRCLVLGYPDIRFVRTPPRDKAKVRYL